MPSPDLRNYIDLGIYDREPAELVDRALLDATAKLPGWTPREGNTEVVLIEALALIVAEAIYATNRLPGAVVEVLLRLFGVERSEGVAPTATATFTLSDDAGHTVPAGTVVRLELGGLAEPVLFTTDEDLVVAAASSSGTVAITAATGTAEANGIAAGTNLDVLSAVLFVDGAELATAVSGGADPEDDLAWLNRGVERLSRLTDSLVLPEHFTSYALEDVRVYRATTIDNTDPAVGPAGANAGHVTVVVEGSGGVDLSAGVMTELEDAMELKALANLNVHVIAPTVTDVDVTATVRRLAGYTDAEVQANVEAALTAYLSPDVWPWAATVRRNELIALLDGVAGVDYVESLTDPAADVGLTGYGPLANAGVLTITVQSP